jgi:two-component system, LuxR family, sensor kinase FixL
VTRVSTTSVSLRERPVASQSLAFGVGYIALYLFLDWISYVEPVRHTGITPWNPNTGITVALLLARGGRWAPVVAVGIFLGELLTEHAPFAWRPTGLSSLYLTAVYTLAAWGLRKRGISRPIETPLDAAWFVGVTAVATGAAAAGYVWTLVNAGELEASEAWGSIGRYWIGEFNGIVALTPLLLLRLDLQAVWDGVRRTPREFILQCVWAAAGVGLAFALVVARDVRLFFPLFIPVTWIALRRGVPGAMVSVSLVQAALVAALELTPGSIPLFDVQFPLLSLGITALFLGALATQRDAAIHHMRDQDSALQRAMRFAVAGQLASALAHELNQPMTALLSYVRASEIMAEPLASADPRLVTTLSKANAEAVRAAAVLRRLREFYRGEGVRLEPVDVASLCGRVVASLQERTRRNAVELEMSSAESLPTVMVDRTQLEIVVHNLLTNALDAFDTLTSARHRRRVEITVQMRDSDVVIAVEDSGPGLSESVAERLFEPFVTSKANGMGLGLSISRLFLRNQGGDLWIEPGHLGGARFVTRLTTRAIARTNL